MMRRLFNTRGSYEARASWARLNARIAGCLQPGLLTVSGFGRGELSELGLAPAQNIHVVPNGADHVLCVAGDDGALTRLGLEPRGYALALSTLQGHKNIPLLLNAFATPELLDLPLLLAGRTARSEFEAAGFLVPPNVIFADLVSDAEMRALQENALAFCTPSLTEGFGLQPLESMLLGTPAVIAPCGALPEVCGSELLRAVPHKSGEWVQALLRLRDNPDYFAKLAGHGRKWAAGFTRDRAAARLQDCLDLIFLR